MSLYCSTRGAGPINFEKVVTSGLAPDGGLYIPDEVPVFSDDELDDLTYKTYPEVALAVLSKFTGGEIPADELRKIIDKTYSRFEHSAIAPLKQVGHRHYVCELFHGPTFAFKDYALQLLGNLIDYFLAKSGRKAVILVSTSGDTGSAAIYACGNLKNARVIALHPSGLVSEFQRKQMTTFQSECGEDNVKCFAVDGTFDDCQNLVKRMFQEGGSEFAENGVDLISVNSINYVRLIAQVVYYAYITLRLDPGRLGDLSFCVPTGNFGNIYAALVAQKMGFISSRAICATNSNNILHRFFADNDYSYREVAPTATPSMDIGIASNFERFLCALLGNDKEKLVGVMADFKKSGKVVVPPEVHDVARKVFASGFKSDAQTTEAVQAAYKATGEVLDPHSAIAYCVAEDFIAREPNSRTRFVSIATAHPVKFMEFIASAGLTEKVHVPPYYEEALARIKSSPERCENMKNDFEYFKSVVNDVSHF